AEHHDLPSAAGELAVARRYFRANMVAAFALPEDVNARAAAAPFARDDFAESVHGRLIAARRFACDELPEQRDYLFLAAAQIPKKVGHSRKFRPRSCRATRTLPFSHGTRVCSARRFCNRASPFAAPEASVACARRAALHPIAGAPHRLVSLCLSPFCGLKRV